MLRLKKLVRKWLDLDEIEQSISAARNKLEEQMRTEFRAETMEYLCQIQDLRDELNERLNLLSKLAELDRTITDAEIAALRVGVNNANQI